MSTPSLNELIHLLNTYFVPEASGKGRGHDLFFFFFPYPIPLVLAYEISAHVVIKGTNPRASLPRSES